MQETFAFAPEVKSTVQKAGRGKCAFFQPKLTINHPGDQYEKEADEVADKVMRMKDPSTHTTFFKPSVTNIYRKCKHCEEEEKKLHRKESGNERPMTSATESYIKSMSGGTSLSKNERNFFEPRIGYDFSNVKIYTDNDAAESAKSVNALAYTTGNNIVFASGQYQPETDGGKRLLAHELTHTVQQKNSAKKIQRNAIPANLNLPCKSDEYFFEESNIGGIRILVAMAEKDRKSLPSLKQISTQIAADNKTISDPKFQVNTCIISESSTRFALYKGEPVLMIDPKDANLETIQHEMGHGVLNFISHNKDAQLGKGVKAEDWMADLADIFLQLQNITLNKDKDNTITANFIVDPSGWNPGAKAEHPTDVDEFFASAKAAFQSNKKALKNTFAKYGKQDKTVTELGNRLISLLEFLFEKGKLGKQSLASTPEKIKDNIQGISEPSKVEDTIALHPLTDKLLNPDNRKDCK